MEIGSGARGVAQPQDCVHDMSGLIAIRCLRISDDDVTKLLISAVQFIMRVLRLKLVKVSPPPPGGTAASPGCRGLPADCAPLPCMALRCNDYMRGCIDVFYPTFWMGDS